jgi:hypothetical protein
VATRFFATIVVLNAAPMLWWRQWGPTAGRARTWAGIFDDELATVIELIDLPGAFGHRHDPLPVLEGYAKCHRQEHRPSNPAF